MFNVLLKTVFTAGLTIVTALGAHAEAPSYSLKILHINDHHSHLLADSRMDLTLAGERTRVTVGGFPRLVALFDTLSANRDNVLKLHAGDAITGDLYYTLFKGEADAALMNEICFDAFALGNHEFDDGDAGLVNFIDHLHSGICQTPVLGANVKPEVGVSPLAPERADDYIKPFVLKKINGQLVGIIGINIAKKTKNSSSPDETTIFLDEIETAQTIINQLEMRGVNKIIILSHFQYENELKMATQLTGADVIIGGDSHSLLGNFKDVGLNTEGPYPTVVPSADGKTVCVAQAWQYAAVLGELDVSFDHNGEVIGCQGIPHMPISDSFKRKNASGERVELEGAARAAVLAAVEANKEVSIVSRDTEAMALLADYTAQVDVMKGSKIGIASDTLCLERIPGQGKSKLCNVNDTASQGSDITNIVAHAFRQMSRTSDIAIQNGGGVRVDLSEGDITIGDAYILLPFANTLMELEMSGKEIHSVLEDAMDYTLSEGGSTGAYPYAAGLRWDVKASNAKGQRILNIEFKGPNDTVWSALDRSRIYKVVTNNYIAGGRDGYLSFKPVVADGRAVDTYLDYAQSFVDYVKSVGTLSKLPASEYSTKSFSK